MVFCYWINRKPNNADPANYIESKDPGDQIQTYQSTIMKGLYGPKSGITRHEELWLPNNEKYKLAPCFIPSFQRPKN